MEITYFDILLCSVRATCYITQKSWVLSFQLFDSDTKKGQSYFFIAAQCYDFCQNKCNKVINGPEISGTKPKHGLS